VKSSRDADRRRPPLSISTDNLASPVPVRINYKKQYVKLLSSGEKPYKNCLIVRRQLAMIHLEGNEPRRVCFRRIDTGKGKNSQLCAVQRLGARVAGKRSNLSTSWQWPRKRGPSIPVVDSGAVESSVKLFIASPFCCHSVRIFFSITSMPMPKSSFL